MSQRAIIGTSSTRATGAAPRRRSLPERRVAAHQDIAQLAYLKWQKRGCPLGDAQSDWLAAEAELKSQLDVVACTNK